MSSRGDSPGQPSRAADREAGERRGRNLILAVLVALIVLIALQSAGPGPRAALLELAGHARNGYGLLAAHGRNAGSAILDRLGFGPSRRPEPAMATERAQPARPVAPPTPPPEDRKSVREALNRLYSTADVDPLVTGQLYEHNNQVRHIYAQRTAYPEDDLNHLEDLAIGQSGCRSAYGLTEYNSSRGSNMVGVDIGPYGLDEYAGLSSGFDDGVPEQWNLPSTPIRGYKPHQEDYYDPNGLEVYSVGLYALSVPDHDPLVG